MSNSEIRWERESWGRVKTQFDSSLTMTHRETMISTHQHDSPTLFLFILMNTVAEEITFTTFTAADTQLNPFTLLHEHWWHSLTSIDHDSDLATLTCAGCNNWIVNNDPNNILNHAADASNDTNHESMYNRSDEIVDDIYLIDSGKFPDDCLYLMCWEQGLSRLNWLMTDFVLRVTAAASRYTNTLL